MAANGLERCVDRHNTSLLSKVWLQKYETNSICKDSEIDEEYATPFNQLRDDDDITVEDFITFDDNVTTSPDQINTYLVDWTEKSLKEAIEYVVSNDLDSNEGQNPEVISDNECHMDTVHSELTTS